MLYMLYAMYKVSILYMQTWINTHSHYQSYVLSVACVAFCVSFWNLSSAPPPTARSLLVILSCYFSVTFPNTYTFSVFVSYYLSLSCFRQQYRIPNRAWVNCAYMLSKLLLFPSLSLSLALYFVWLWFSLSLQLHSWSPSVYLYDACMC